MRNRYVRRVAGLCAAAFVLSSAGCGMGRDRIGQEAAVQDQSADQDSPGTRRIQGHPQGKRNLGTGKSGKQSLLSRWEHWGMTISFPMPGSMCTPRRNCPG